MFWNVGGRGKFRFKKIYFKRLFGQFTRSKTTQNTDLNGAGELGLHMHACKVAKRFFFYGTEKEMKANIRLQSSFNTWQVTSVVRFPHETLKYSSSVVSLRVNTVSGTSPSNLQTTAP